MLNTLSLFNDVILTADIISNRNWNKVMSGQ